MKAAISGIVAFVCMVFVAFGREYARECRAQEAMQQLSILGTGVPLPETPRRDAPPRPVRVLRRRRVEIDKETPETTRHT